MYRAIYEDGEAATMKGQPLRTFYYKDRGLVSLAAEVLVEEPGIGIHGVTENEGQKQQGEGFSMQDQGSGRDFSRHTCSNSTNPQEVIGVLPFQHS